MARAEVQRRYDDLHNEDSLEQFHDGSFTTWFRKRTDATPFAHNDGVTLWVATEDLSPDDDFLKRGEQGGGSPGGRQD